MHLHRYGTGRRIFFGLHGWSGTHQTFAPFASHLPADVSLFAVDLPASGLSPRPTEWSLEWFEKALGEVMASLPCERLTLIGNCSGALLGLLGAARVMPRVERFVLLDPFAYTPWYFRLFLVPLLGEMAYYSSFANPLGRWLTNLSLAKHRQDATDLTESFGRVDHAAALRYLKLFDSMGSIERFRALVAPTDIYFGARTFAAVKSSVTMWQSLWPHATAQAVDAGHLPIEEATAQLSRRIFCHS
ncbi:MAG: alpha/beta fold hydrolase [Acidobacteria bacterium]|nr:alpha/beta fold hydrolase [Acidobacteriota bacterium]